MKSLLPPNEAARLAALRHYDVLDTAPEEAFDDLTLLAAQICQAPMAMVSLVDENRQWFKSKIGTQAPETPRAVAFCAHTILHADEIMEVRDASADPRFAANPLVTTDPHIRFYAGAPLVTPEGHALGALCVIDRVPRTLTPEQIAALRALSRRVVDQLELRRHTRNLASGAQETRQNLAVAETSRRALLSLLEDQKLTEITLRESEARFRQITETIQEVFWMTDVKKNQMIYVSPGYEKIWGRTCASLYTTPREWLESIHPEDRERVIAAAESKQAAGSYDETYRILRPDGALRWIRDQAFPVKAADGTVLRLVGVAEDVTERKKYEEQALRAQRLESIGMLAAGITHDLNNVLAPIGMAATLLRDRLSATSDLRLIDTLEKCADRGAGLVRQILGFVHGIGDEPSVVQVKHLLRDITTVVTETFPKSITLNEEVPNELWPILANPTQIHQVLLNLCVNARDAMPNGGTLTVGAENCVLDAKAAAAIEGAKPGAWLVLHIEDTGTGIPPAVVARMWEPFFSTKPLSKGTGLGLSTVRGIIETCHGFITLRTGLGRGTCFRVYLPAAQSVIAADGSAHPYSSKRGRGELILLVDDEELIRDLAGATLTKAGYRVITTADGFEAAGAFESNVGEIALIITDLDMPNVDGETLVEVIRTFKPHLKILAMSGGGSRQSKARPTEFASAFMAKPFSAETLLTHVDKLLHGASAIT